MQYAYKKQMNITLNEVNSIIQDFSKYTDKNSIFRFHNVLWTVLNENDEG